MTKKNDSGEKPIRMADLCSGEGRATRAALAAGMEVVYVRDEPGLVPLTDVPEFDLVVISLPDAASLSESALSQALILARERQPEAVVIEGPAPRTHSDTVALREVCRDLERAGYFVNFRPEISDEFRDSRGAWRAVIIGTMRRFVFVWPDEVGYGDDDEIWGIRAAMPREGRPSSLLLALMAAMETALRGPLTVEVWRSWQDRRSNDHYCS